MSEELFSKKFDKKFDPYANFRRSVSRKLLLSNSKKFLKTHEQMVIFSHDIVSHHINLDGFYEIEELDLIFSWLEDLNSTLKDRLFDGNALDIGANIGNHSIFFSKYFKKVFSFEPHPKIFKLLEINSKLKQNIEIKNIGLSDTSKSSRLFFSKENMGASSLEIFTQSSSDITVQLERVDDLDYLNNISFIKIDVEGHEYEVLKGSEQVITSNQPVIMFEQFPDEFKNGSSKVLDLLKTMGYKKFVVMERSPNFQIKYLSIVINILSALIFGKKILLKEEKEFSKKYYQFILAIPAWIQDKRY